MDFPSHLAATATGLIAGAALSEATDPLIGTIGGWASFGGAVACVWAAAQDEPRWERSIGYGTAGGAVVGSLILLSDIMSA